MEREPLRARLSRRLREARVSAGLTVREAAQLARIASHSLLVRYENGHSSPPPARLEALADAYQTTVAALLAERDEAVPLIKLIERADPATLQQLLKALH
jgi:transcriptional regulator with XRE-family HTH domain